MKKYILLFAILLGVAIGGTFSPRSAVIHNTIVALQPKPVHLAIPSVGISANVEQVGLDSTGAMDVPQNINDVAWYKLGPLPGEKGSAVIDGHLDSKTGPAIFANLSEVKPGDRIQLTNEKGKVKTFIVERTANYDEASFPLKEVFDSTDKPRLNLITCTGYFNQNLKEYSKRFVVYSVLQN